MKVIKNLQKYQYSKTPKNKTEIFVVEVFVFKRMEEMNLSVVYILENWDINPQRIKNKQNINTQKHLN